MTPKEKEDLILVLSCGIIPLLLYPVSQAATWFGTYMSQWNTEPFGWGVTILVCTLCLFFGLKAPEVWIKYVHSLTNQEDDDE